MESQIKIFDTHVHLNNDKMFRNAQGFIEKAIENNVVRMNVVGYDQKTNSRALELIKKHDSLVASIGFHPTEVKNININHYDELKKNLSIPNVVALGEIGYDYYWDTTTKTEQTEAFITQLDIAVETKKPVIIHVREALQDTYEVLKKYGPMLNGGILHCFSGSPEMASKFIDAGFYISLAGPVTFKNARVPKEVAKNIPLERLVIETDAPYLAPHPYRGKLNEPAFVALVAEEIAKIRNISFEDLASITYDNAEKLFSLK